MYVGDLTMRNHKIKDGAYFDSISGVVVEPSMSIFPWSNGSGGQFGN